MRARLTTFLAMCVLALGCDEPAPSLLPAPSGAKSVLGGPAEAGSAYVAPAATLAPSVASRPLGRWPESDRPLDARALAALLPPAEAGRVELGAAGDEPRGAVAHRLEAGAVETLVVEVDLAVVVAQGDDTTVPAVPALEVTVSLTQREAKDGLGRVELAIEKTALHARREEEREVAREMEPLVKKLAGIRAVMGVTAQGLATAPPTPAGVEPEVLQLWSSVAEAVGDAVVPFPLEPIGTGAVWTVLDRVRRAGVDMLRRTRWTLVSRKDGELQIEGEVTEVPIAGTAHDPSLPKELELSVESGLAAGKRRARVGSQLWPLASTTELSSDLVLVARPRPGAGLGQSEPRTSRVKITEVLRAIRGDVVDAGAPAGQDGKPKER